MQAGAHLTSPQCPRCHAPLPEGNRDEECPRCLLDASGDLLRLGAGAGPVDAAGSLEPVFAAGVRLGPYEIDAFIARGGMGEIYRARDTRLHRTVAIKAMRPRLARTGLWREQFDSEARVVAKLNHPHICGVYDVGHAGGTPFVVMEFVDGETLASRLTQGPLPVVQALDYGVQIARALDEAHRHGIVHRDVKPANLVITARGIKLLDFGLAGLGSGGAIAGGAAGTPIYMAPEQASGTGVDHRADLFAFGVILHEMLSGGLPFAADPQRPAPLPADCPVDVAATIRRCIAERPEDRIASARELVAVLERAHRQLSDADSVRPPPTRIVVSAIAAVLLLATTVSWNAARVPTSPASLRFTLTPPPAPGRQNDPRGLAVISPDGRRVAWVVSHRDTRTSLALQALDGGPVRYFAGTDRARMPAWTADGERLLFFVPGHLRSLSARTGAVTDLAPATYGQGATENRFGEVLFAPDLSSPLYMIPAQGRAPVRLRDLDAASGEIAQQAPVFLPDSRRYVYLSVRADGRHAIYLGDLRSDSTRRIVASDSAGVLSPPDVLVFVRQQALQAVRLDLVTGGTAGPVRTIETVVHTSRNPALAMFSASSNGTLVFHTLSAPASQLVWFDRSGRRLDAITEPGIYRHPVLGDHGVIAVQHYRTPGAAELVVVSGHSRIPTPLPGAERASAAAWAPGGERLAFAVNYRNRYALFTMTLDGHRTLVLEDAGTAVPMSWSPNGRLLLYECDVADRGVHLRVASLETGETRPYLDALPNARHGRFSPNGRWIAYASDVTGRPEVYVDRFPGGGARRQVSPGGGRQPVWRGDGRELFYISPEHRIVAVSVRADRSALGSGAPIELFEVPRGELLDGGTYAVSPDGERILLNLEGSRGSRTGVMVATLVTNWRRQLEGES